MSWIIEGSGGVPWICSYARSITAVILLVAAVSKLGTHEELAAIIDNYRLLPHRLSLVVARELPVAEMIIAGMLLTRSGTKYAGVAAAVLFVIFGGAMAINLLRGRANIACGCFGASQSSPIKWRYVIRNVVLSACALVGVEQFWPAGVSHPLAISDELAALLAASVTLACYWMALTSAMMLKRVSEEVRPAK